VGLHRHPRQDDFPAGPAAGVVADVAGGGRIGAGAAGLAWTAGNAAAADVGLRRHRRARGAALAHLLWRDQAVQRLGRCDLHGAGYGVRRNDRALAGANWHWACWCCLAWC
jgi:hypothetical protein